MNNDIALSFDKAEYYSLDEASEYLNRKHGIDNITPKKLLRHIYQREINCYIYMSSNYALDISYQHENDSPIKFIDDLHGELLKLSCETIAPQIDENIQLEDDKEKDVFSMLDTAFSNNFFGCLSQYGLFLKPNDKTLYALTTPNKNEAYCNCFVGCVDVFNMSGESNWDSLLEHTWVKDNEVIYRYDNIRGISLFTKNTDEIIREKMASFLPFECKIRKVKDSFYFEICISIDDIVIFQDDLLSLESQIIENAPVPTKEIAKIDEVIEKTHPRASNNYAKIISALSNMAGVNLTEPYGKDNKAILETMERLGLEKIPSNDTIAKTLKEAHEISK